MLELIQAIPFAFAALFPVVNPIGSSFIFLALVDGSSTPAINKLALKIAIYAAALLGIVLIAGSGILRLFGITIPIVLIGGGMVLAYIGWQMLNQPDGTTNNTAASVDSDKKIDEMAFYPLTMPVTAGPGCIAVAIALGAHSIGTDWESTILSEIGNCIGILLIGVSIFFCYRYAHAITRKLGTAGTRVIMRMAAFINLCIGLQLIYHGVQYIYKP